MRDWYFENTRIYQNGRLTVGSLLCQQGKIVAVGPQVENPGLPRVDCRGLMLVPGFIDSHTHGAVGVDVNSADAEEIRRIGRFFAQQGTTAWNASILTDTEQQTLTAIQAVCEAMQHPQDSVPPLGIHLEGPFLSVEYKGAMPEHLLQAGDAQLFRRYQQAAGGAIRYITVSPEVAGVTEMVADIADEVTVGVGHSGATYDQTMATIRNGARCCTHTLNAMRLLHQHEPAVMGAALESDIWCEMICDGRHLHPGTVRFLLKCKGLDKVVAVTDSIMAAGLGDGEYHLGVNRVTVKNGDAVLTETGVRAGSTLTMQAALKNLVRFTGLSVEQVLPILTQNPAECLRITDRKGRIAPGLDADLVLLDDELNVCATYANGRCVYSAI
ncbi:MAG: N-acetylglucosamine-6-phosphate deacetylase [Faecalibacterium sp.]|nr:N-acetylglucosamine-6-phosphate deacetylase [Faecalibacterium sp.]